jgi:hypothetical protein
VCTQEDPLPETTEVELAGTQVNLSLGQLPGHPGYAGTQPQCALFDHNRGNDTIHVDKSVPHG